MRVPSRCRLFTFLAAHNLPNYRLKTQPQKAQSTDPHLLQSSKMSTHAHKKQAARSRSPSISTATSASRSSSVSSTSSALSSSGSSVSNSAKVKSGPRHAASSHRSPSTHSVSRQSKQNPRASETGAVTSQDELAIRSHKCAIDRWMQDGGPSRRSSFSSLSNSSGEQYTQTYLNKNAEILHLRHRIAKQPSPKGDSKQIELKTRHLKEMPTEASKKLLEEKGPHIISDHYRRTHANPAKLHANRGFPAPTLVDRGLLELLVSVGNQSVEPYRFKDDVRSQASTESWSSEDEAGYALGKILKTNTKRARCGAVQTKHYTRQRTDQDDELLKFIYDVRVDDHPRNFTRIEPTQHRHHGKTKGARKQFPPVAEPLRTLTHPDWLLEGRLEERARELYV